MLNLEIDKLATLDQDNTLSQGKAATRWFTLRKLIDNYLEDTWRTAKVIALPGKAGFTGQYFKGFMREKFGTEYLLFIRQQITKPTPSDIKRQLIKRWGITTATDSIKRHFIIQLFREILLYLNQKVIVYDFINDPAYTKYQKEHRIKRLTMPTEKICFTIWTTNYYTKHTCTLQEIIPFLHSKYGKNRPIVYADLENPFTEAFMNMGYPELIVIGAAKNKMSLLAKGLPKWIKPIESLYSADNRVLQKYAAVAFIKEQPEIDGSFSPKPIYPKPIRELLMELKKKITKYSKPSSYGSYVNTSILQIVPPQKYDMEIMALWHQVEKWAKIGFIIDIRLALGQRYNELSYYFLMKAKKFRMDWDFYNKMKNCIKNLLENYETNSMQ